MRISKKIFPLELQGLIQIIIIKPSNILMLQVALLHVTVLLLLKCSVKSGQCK